MAKTDIKNIDMGVTMNGFRRTLVKRYLAPYRRYQHWLHETQWRSLEDLIEYQNTSLRALVRYVFNHVPWYRQWQEKHKIDTDLIWTSDDLAQLPILEKQDIQKDPELFVSDKYRKKLLYRCHTSGSTGTPLTLYRNLANVGFEHALMMRQYSWAGIKPNDRVAILKGDLVPEAQLRKNNYWLASRLEKRLYMSSYHLSAEHLPDYIAAIEKYGPAALDGYPSSIYLLARYLEAQNRFLPMKAVLTSSETLSDEQRFTIQRVFQCRVYDYYGLAERVAAIHMCEHGHYHIIPEYGIVEMVKFKDSEECCEVVATSLNNRAMPLLRFRTGDVIKPADKEPCACGRHYPRIKSIEGRKDDYITTPDGRMIGRLDHVFKGSEHVLLAQIFQPDQEHLIVRVVPDQAFSQRDSDFIVNQLARRVGDGMKISIETVTELQRGGRGKLKSVISHVQSNMNKEGAVS